MAVTRINNNQISDAINGNAYVGINAAVKLQNYSVTATKIANNLTYGSDLTITGNLLVQGNTTTIDTTYTTIEDPILLLASNQTGSPTVDIGFVGQRGTSENIAFVWDESAGEFVTVYTTSGETNTTVSIAAYANIHSGNANIGSNLVVNGTSSFVGNLIGNVNVTANVAAGNILTNGLISATGNISGASAAFTGNITAQSFIGNISGNVDAGGANTQVQFNDNELLNGTAGFTFDKTSNAVTITGNVTGGNLLTAGLVTATGNITGANLITGGNVFAPAIIANSSTYDTRVSLSSVAGIIEINPNGNATQFTPSGQINLSGVSTIAGGTFSGSGFTAGASQTDLFQNRGGNVTVQVGTGGSITNTWTFTNSGNLLAPGNVSATGNITGGNISTAGLVSATGNIESAANVSGGNVIATTTVTAPTITGTIVSASGNITGGNLITGGLISATGNITSAANVAGGNLLATTAVLTPTVIGTTVTVSSTGGLITLAPSSNVSVSSKYINDLSDPVQDQDAATKIYVDNKVTTAIAYHEAVVAATVSTLETATGGTITYAQPNGAGNGVGATLTVAGGTFDLIDTANVQTANTRILVKDQANAVLNGIYVWSNATVITRSADADTYGAADADALSVNDYFFVSSGNVNKGSAYIVDSPQGVITFGTSNIQFAQFSQSQVYTANTQAGISIVGTVISAKVDNDTTAFDGGGNIIVKAGANLTTPNIGAATGTSLSVTGNLTGAGANISGNVTGGNLLTSGLINATGDITSTANVTGGNLLTSGQVSSTGNITSTANISGGNVIATTTVSAASLLGSIVSVTGNVTGGNLVTSGVVSSTGNITSAANVSGGNLLTGGQISSTGNITSAANIAGGNISASGNITASYYFGNGSQLTGVAASTSGFPVTSGTSNIAAVTNGNISITVAGTPNVAVFAADGAYVTGLVSATGNITSSANIGAANVVATNISATGNITGANINTGGTNGLTLNGSNINANAGRITINSDDSDVDFAINGDTTANVFYVDAGTGTASFGSSTQTTNAVVAFNASNSILLPVGNTAQRPDTGVTGMLRFNSTLDAVEIYDTDSWTTVGTPSFTVVTDDQFTGNGVQVAYTLANAYTTNSVIVSINGVVQIPTTAYSVSGNALTFTEAPQTGDFIDVRGLTTTTQVTSISNSPGNAVVSTNPTVNEVNITGNLVPVANNTQSLGSASLRWKDLYVAGNSIYIGNIVMKNTSGNTVAFYGPDGTTPATIDSTNVDTTTIASGTSNVRVQSSGGNVAVGVGGSNIVRFTTAGIVNDMGNGVGNIGNATGYFNTVFAKATSAQYADLAEIYAADAKYEPGTVLSFGGDKEVTLSTAASDHRIAGVVSTNPSYVMNATLESQYTATVALTGRVPTKVSGPVAKGDMMISAGNGRAVACATPTIGTVIGKALENHSGGDGVIEVVVGRL